MAHVGSTYSAKYVSQDFEPLRPSDITMSDGKKRFKAQSCDYRPKQGSHGVAEEAAPQR
jgi:hypothetical protein